MTESTLHKVSTEDGANPYRALAQQLNGDRDRMRSREVAYEAIKGAVLAGLLEPRERLIEERLGEALQLSRTPIREALAILEHEGLIESIPYKGLIVRAVSVSEFLSMYEALGVIEAVIARAAVPHVTQEDIRDLEEILDQAERCIPDDVPGHLAACREFQQKLGAVAKSLFLTRQLVSIEERSDMYLIHSHNQLSPGNMMAAVDDRRNILAAVLSGTPEAAAQAAEAHADRARARWKTYFAQDERDASRSRRPPLAAEARDHYR